MIAVCWQHAIYSLILKYARHASIFFRGSNRNNKGLNHHASIIYLSFVVSQVTVDDVVDWSHVIEKSHLRKGSVSLPDKQEKPRNSTDFREISRLSADQREKFRLCTDQREMPRISTECREKARTSTDKREKSRKSVDRPDKFCNGLDQPDKARNSIDRFGEMMRSVGLCNIDCFRPTATAV
ncbi:hypothetical protein DITRI_Ditri11bG0025000 [Diplodiscus trichospermus]